MPKRCARRLPVPAFRRAGRAALLVFFLAGVAAEALAQTPYVPYYGKNKIRYTNFEWHIYTTDHFEIYYYPEIEPHLERITSYAESAYQQVSADLKHDLAFKVPMVLFKSQTDFQQQNIIPMELPEGVLAFAEPYRDRMVLPIDEPSDALYRLIVHELTHIFEFDIIPRSLLRRGLPLWVDEGLADFMTGYWNAFDLMTVRDAAVSDNIPRMSDFEGAQFADGRLPYNLGHAAFEFIESRWGKEGIRQFLFALRKNVIGGGESAYEEAFRLRAEEFDDQFDRYLKERFKPFRDKERPNDYGRNLAPRRDRTPYVAVISIEASPSGELLAVAAANRKDQELDIILVSTRDGRVIRNLTAGFNKSKGFEYIRSPGGFRSNAVPWMSWSPLGDRIAYFVRTEKVSSLILQNVVNRRIERRIPLNTVDLPESPAISPDGREVAFGGLSNAIGDIFVLNLDTNEVRNVTNDQFGAYGPTWSPDGRSLIYLARISGNDKLFRLDLATGAKTQLTFGTHDDGAAKFLDEDTIVFPSTAMDPNEPVDPEVARNGNIYNLWTLRLKTGELRQYTDTLTANVSPAVIRDEKDAQAIAFITYYKGEYGIHTLNRTEPIATVATEDFGSPGPIIDFQAPLTHTLVRANTRKKGTFEKLFLEGRPPVNVGVTSGGDLFGGTQVTFTDVLGDKQFNLFAASVAQYRTMSFSYVNLARRFQYAMQAYSQTQFYYGYNPGLLFAMEYGFIDRDLAIATQTARGATGYGIYPLNRYARLELSAGLLQFQQSYNEPGLQQIADEFQRQQFGRTLFNTGSFMPFGLSYVQETTVFRPYGPLSGNTMRLSYEYAPSVGSMLSRQTADADVRFYRRIATNGVFAVRGRAYKSWGEFPGYIYFGGNSEMRGYQYLEFLGNNGFFTNAELRFPLIEAALTPIGIIGGLRGTLFFNFGGAGFEGLPMKVWSTSSDTYTPLLGFVQDPFSPTGQQPVFGPELPISGFRLIDSRASYGIGLQTFALGFPIHFDWSWRTLFNRDWEDLLYAYPAFVNGFSRGSDYLRKPKFSVWIGYDF
jgi:hypothetical protein